MDTGKQALDWEYHSGSKMWHSRLFVCLILLFLTTAKTAFAVDVVISVAPAASDIDQPCSLPLKSTTLQGISLKTAIELANCGKWTALSDRDKVNVRIELQAGTYRIESPLTITWGNDPGQGALTVIGLSKANTIISGGRLLTQFQKVSDPVTLALIPVLARDHVLQAEVSTAGIQRLDPEVSHIFGNPPKPATTELFFNGKAMVTARWPNRGWARIRISSRSDSQTSLRFGIEGADVTRWSGNTGLMAKGYFAYNWAEESIPVMSIQPETNDILMPAPGPRFGLRDGGRVRIENSLADLDKPGEWVLNRERGLVYFWPPMTTNLSTTELSVAETLLIINKSRNVRVSSLIFEITRGDAIKITDSEDVLLEQSLVRNAGNRGVVIFGGRNSGVSDIEIEQVGEGGVVLSGGNRKTLVPASLFVSRSKFRNFNRLCATYRPAVQVDGVGNRVERNLITDAPHSAIIFRGNDHYIAFNNISRVVEDTEDAGAIYTGRDWSARGTIIENNFLHDIGRSESGGPGVMGIYLDDQASGIVVRGNVFARVQQPVFVGGGRDNIVTQNLFFRSSPAIHLDARGLTWQRAKTLDSQWDLQQKLHAVPYRETLYAKRYPHLAGILDDDFGAPKYNEFNINLIIDSMPFEIHPKASNGISTDHNMKASENIFQIRMDSNDRMKPTDFRLKDSFNLNEGFHPPEFDKMEKSSFGHPR